MVSEVEGRNRWLTPEQFRLRHGLSRGLVYALVAEGKLSHVRLHSKILIKASALDELVVEDTPPDLEGVGGC
jgi:excisionase family DNA binding protein